MDNAEKQIINEIECRKSELINYLCTLIGFASENEGVTGTSRETELQNYLYEDFLNSGFDTVSKIDFDNKNHRPNIIGVLKGNNSSKALMLNAHADVVPVKEEEMSKWVSDPYKAVKKDSKIFGRGASDCKGGLAAIIFAARILRELKIKLKNDLYILSSSGEESQEGDSIGISLAVDKGYRPHFALIAEPSNCEIIIEGAGNLLLTLKIKGKEAHCGVRNQIIFPQRYGLSSGSSVGVDAIAKAVPFIELMQKIEIENCHRWKTKITNSGGYPLPVDQQGLGFFTITPVKIEGGQGLGSVSGYVNIIFNISYPSWLKEDQVLSYFRKKIMYLSRTDEWLNNNPPELSIQGWGPFRTPLNHPGVKLLAQSLQEIQKELPIYSSFKSVCDATFLYQKGIPVVVFGPGGLNSSVHGPNEFVPIDELVKTAKTVALFAYKYCK